MSAKRTSWNEFSSSMASAIICLSTGMIVAQQDDDIADEGAASVVVDDVPAAVDEPSITSPPPTTQPPPPSQDLPSTSYRRIIANMDANEDVALKDVADIAKEVVVDAEIEENDELEPIKLKEVAKVVTIAKLMTEVVNAASATITTADTLITDDTPITADALTAAPSAARRRKGVKEDNVLMRYQALKRKLQTESQARKNMMINLRNMVGLKMDYFKGMSYDDIRPIFEKYFNSNVAFLENTKEQMAEEDSRALKRENEMPNDKDDVYIEATPLAHKVFVVDYEIYTENNKPYYKIIRADGSPQLFLSFLSLLRNFDIEDLEVLWQLVKERFASSKPKNFLDDFLLTTLTYMFEKPDVQAQVWKNQRTVHGLTKVKSQRLLESCRVHIITFTSTQMILLVERRYPLTSFRVDAAKDFKENMLILGQVTHLVASLTLDRARSCVMQVTSLAHGKLSNIPTVHCWGNSIGPDSFLPFILLLVVIVVAVVIVVVEANEFHQDKASSVRVPVANFTMQSSVQLLLENTNSVRLNQHMSLTTPSVPFKLKVFAMLAACASRAVATLSATSFLMAA
nr:hypothetical protein [Tanacetum cinerariifolium]